MRYTQTQWLLIFFAYCILGWVWECAYVSIKERRWSNRGFLHGPWLPIYGAGAVIILWATLPVQKWLPLVFLLGMASATLLELVTGLAMERLFHIRYWDYSDMPLNIRGHICVPASLAWGCFSMLLVRLLHPPVARVVLMVPTWLGDLLGLTLTVLFVIDSVKSVQTALSLRELLDKLTENNQTLQRVERYLNEAGEQLSEASDVFRQRMRETGEAISAWREHREQERAAAVQGRREALLRKLDERRSRRSGLLAALQERCDAELAETARQMEGSLSQAERARLQAIQNTLADFRKLLRQAEVETAAWRNRDYQRAVSLLERNPSAVSRRYPKALSELSGLKRGSRGKKSRDVSQ